MNIFRLAFELFTLYLLYKLIFDFVIPLFKTTQQVKKQFGDMSARMEKMNEKQEQTATYNSSKTSVTPGKRNDDYIEFEEVK